jgi:dihydroorotate dehydrogenase electron transfer subunit
MKRKEICEVISQKEIAEDIYELTVKGDFIQDIESPGQFVHIKVANSHDPLLRRPISISSYNKNNKQLTMIYRKDGRGTSLLAEHVAGMDIDILGPLGNGFPVDETKMGQTALLVGGGIGVPPLYELSNQLKANGVKVIHVLGFQTDSVVFYEQEFAANGQTFIATVDGSHGTKGFVTDVIDQQGIEFDVLYSCGPLPMLRALEQKFPNKTVFLSLEERMGCGVGACFACVCKTKDDPEGTSYKKVCSDGPVFRAGEVVL